MTTTTSSSASEVYVWDRFVRTFHWALVCCVLLNYFVLEDELHEWVGYTAVALVVARLIWGFIGSPYARFSEFFPTPGRISAHLQHMRSGAAPASPGHNPLGALMMLWLMGVVLLLGATGWMQGTDEYFGEEWLQDLHELLGNLLIASAGLHAAAAIWMGSKEKTNLVHAMVTGVKKFRG